MNKRILTLGAAVLMSGAAVADFDPNEFYIGTMCVPVKAQTEKHIQYLKDAGIDYVLGFRSHRPEALALMEKYGIAVVHQALSSRWWVECDRKKDGPTFEELLPTKGGSYSNEVDAARKSGVPQICKMNGICDEPSAQRFDYYAKIIEQFNRFLPNCEPYGNLNPIYARLAETEDKVKTSQLGARTYNEYLRQYCEKVPADHISYDVYCYPQTRDYGKIQRWFETKMYENYQLVADECRNSGRAFWYDAQVDMRDHSKYQMNAEMLRYQAYTAMAYGVTRLCWACWTPGEIGGGWWQDNVLDVDAEPTAVYYLLKDVNAELHRFAPRYMKYRNVDTMLLGFNKFKEEFDKGGVKYADEFNDGFVRHLKAQDDSCVCVGAMVPKDQAASAERAYLLVGANDFYGLKGEEHKVTFQSFGSVRVFTPDGTLPCERGTNDTWTLSLKDNRIAFVVVQPFSDKAGFNRNEFRIGTMCIATNAQSEAHVRDLRDCGIDFICGWRRPTDAQYDMCAKYGIDVIEHVTSRWWATSDNDKWEAALKVNRNQHREEIVRYRQGKPFHPAIKYGSIADEPSALCYEVLGDTVAFWQQTFPHLPAYYNLNPCYARLAENSSKLIERQFGVATYYDYIDQYCQKTATDHVSVDIYPVPERENPETVLNFERWFFVTMQTIGDACHRYGRDFWFDPQINIRPKNTFVMTPNLLRYQAYVGMAYGVTRLCWACWTPAGKQPVIPFFGNVGGGWWRDNVLDDDGNKTPRYDMLKAMNWELRAFAPTFMQYRNVFTTLVSDGSRNATLKENNIRNVPVFNDGFIRDFKSTDNNLTVLGVMVPRAGMLPGTRAYFVVPIGDATDTRKATHELEFRAAGTIKVVGACEPIVPEALGEGRWRIKLADNHAAMIILNPYR